MVRAAFQLANYSVVSTFLYLLALGCVTAEERDILDRGLLNERDRGKRNH